MKLIDTHCHIYLDEFKQDIDAVINRALEAGVTGFYLPAIDSSTHAQMLALEVAFPGKCFAMAGLHPCSVKANYRDELKTVQNMLENRRFSGIGETGLDFYWDRSFEQEQYLSFQEQIEWSGHYQLPLIIHSRESTDQCIDMIRKNQKGQLKGIFHCFSGDSNQAGQIVELGFHLGIGGVLTYKKSTLAESIKAIDMSFLLLETDAPYLSPVPFRGKRNESSYIRYTAAKLSEIKQLSLEDIAELTTRNALKLFGN